MKNFTNIFTLLLLLVGGILISSTVNARNICEEVYNDAVYNWQLNLKVSKENGETCAAEGKLEMILAIPGLDLISPPQVYFWGIAQMTIWDTNSQSCVSSQPLGFKVNVNCYAGDGFSLQTDNHKLELYGHIDRNSFRVVGHGEMGSTNAQIAANGTVQ